MFGLGDHRMMWDVIFLREVVGSLAQCSHLAKLHVFVHELDILPFYIMFSFECVFDFIKSFHSVVVGLIEEHWFVLERKADFKYPCLVQLMTL